MFYGLNNLYDGGGYVSDFDLLMTFKEWEAALDKLFDEGFFSGATRAIFVNLNFYNPSSDQFVVVEILVEFLTSGLVYPTYAKVLSFNPSIYETEKERAMVFCDVCRFILTFYIFFQIFSKVRLVRSLKMKKDLTAEQESLIRAICISTLNDICIVVLFYFVWLLGFDKHNANSEKVLNSKGYIDLSNAAVWYQELFIEDSVCLIFVTIKLLQVFRVSRYVHWVMMTLDKAVTLIFSTLLILVPTFLAFTFFSYIVFGPYMSGY